MAKTLGTVRVRYVGNGQMDATPTTAEFIYQVFMDGVPAHRGLHVPVAPVWTKPLSQFVADEVAAIKVAEGIV